MKKVAINKEIMIGDTGLSLADLNTQVNSQKGKILWTNPNPTSKFMSQNITLSSGDYDILEVMYYDWVNSQNYSSQRVPKGKNISLFTIFDTNDNAFAGSRVIIYNSATSFTVKSAITAINSTAINRTTLNDWCIPVYIIGYKYGIF